MSQLGEVVHSLAARDGVEAVLLLSGDGLPIEHAARGAFDPETVAALAATLAQHAGRLGEGARAGRARARRCSSTPAGSLVLARAGAGDWLAMLAAADADIGPLLYDLRQHRPALGRLLCSDALGRPPRRRLGHPLLAAQHPGEPQAAASALRRRLDRRGSGRAARRPDPARADPGRRRRGAGRPAPRRCSIFPPRTSWSSRAPPPPRRRSSGPRWEAQRRDPDAEVLSLHADWAVGDAAAFRRTADLALTTARPHDRLVTVGVVPSRPETGYGYIVPGAPLDDGARTVARFSEKPDAATALDLMAAGALWNSGLFAWTARRGCWPRSRAHTPEVAAALPRARRPATWPASSATVTPISIDVGLLERSGAVAVVSGRVRLGRRGHLAGAGPGPAQGPERQRRGRARRSCTNRTTASSGPTATRSCSAACRTWSWCRPTAASWSCPPSAPPR